MDLVRWNNAIQIRKRETVDAGPAARKSMLWTNVIKPRSVSELVGNRDAIERIQGFLKDARDNEDKSSCIFIHGEAGTGKSTSLSVIAKDMGFRTVHTYADRQRTPVKLEGMVREAGIFGTSGLVILDDFEIFLTETASLKLLSKFIRSIIRSKSVSSRCLFAIISNSTHKLFGSIQEVSSMVEFKRLERNDMQKVFNRVRSRVSIHSYVPPMAAFFASSSCAGTISQSVQQLQFMYHGNKEVPLTRRSHKRPRSITYSKNSKSSKSSKRLKKNLRPPVGNNRDSITYLWSDMYTDKMLDHLLQKEFSRSMVIDRIMGFGKDKIDILSEQVHHEYPRRIATCSLKSLVKMSKVADHASLSDVRRLEIHEDGLFDGENKEKWSENDINCVVGVSSCILEMKGFERREVQKRKKKKVPMAKYTGEGDPQDAFYVMNILKGCP